MNKSLAIAVVKNEDTEKYFTKEDRKILLELICNEQVHMIIKDNTKYESDKYKKLEELKIKVNSLEVKKSCETLSEIGIPREDIALLLPLGMTTKIVDKRNLRNLVDMSHQRMCTRAYWEYRELFNDICKALSEISEEWKWIVDNLFMPKCEQLGYCPEKRGCGRNPQKEECELK